MNPLPEADGQPEAIAQLPFALCCICLRKLQWLTQAALSEQRGIWHFGFLGIHCKTMESMLKYHA